MNAVPILEIDLFNKMEVRLNGVPLDNLHLRHVDRLLAYMILNGPTVRAETIAELFWPDTASLDSLGHTVLEARKALKDARSCLKMNGRNLHLDLSKAVVDFLQFDKLTESDNVHDMQIAAKLYRGPLLKDWDEPWLSTAREERKEAALALFRKLAEHFAGCDDYPQTISYLRKYNNLKHNNESVWLDLMSVLAASGDRVGAIESYERWRLYLQQRHGISPCPEMTNLYIRLKEQDVTLSQQSEADSAGCESIGGAVPLWSPNYVCRAGDQLLSKALDRREGVIVIIGPRQTGKSSLLARGLQLARNRGDTVLTTGFDQWGSADLVSLESVSRKLIAEASGQIDLTVDPEILWKNDMSAGVNLARFVSHVLLKHLASPIVWSMDEVDRIFPQSYADEFFSVLRAWHTKRSIEPQNGWGRLTLLIACATEAHLYIKDLNKSPFNVGERIQLTDFTLEQVTELNARHETPIQSEQELSTYYRLTGGHPFLVRRGLHAMATTGLSYEQLVASSAEDDGPFGDHLRRITRSLRENNELCISLKDALVGQPCDPDHFFRLRSAGILKGVNHHQAAARCELYADYFGRRL